VSSFDIFYTFIFIGDFIKNIRLSFLCLHIYAKERVSHHSCLFWSLPSRIISDCPHRRSYPLLSSLNFPWGGDQSSPCARWHGHSTAPWTRVSIRRVPSRRVGVPGQSLSASQPGCLEAAFSMGRRLIRRLDLSQPDGLAGDLVDAPSDRVWRFRFSWRCPPYRPRVRTG
jgi:hypothetical protein